MIAPIKNLKNRSRLTKLANLSFLPTIFNLIDINYSIIDKEGNYISQNNSTQTTVSKGLVKAQEIDPVTWEDCKEVMESGQKSIKEEFFKGKYYLSIKQPLIENNDSLGIMVISVLQTA